MENILYERDYTEEHKKAAESGTGTQSISLMDRAIESGFFKAYSDAMHMIPKIINPISKANFEYVRDICDKMAKRWGGKIRAEVRYDKWDGIIDLTLPFIEFGNHDELREMMEISKRVDSATFSPSDTGGICLHIFCYYFTDLATEEEKDDVFMEALTSRPELYHQLLQKMKAEGEDAEEYLEDFLENE